MRYRSRRPEDLKADMTPMIDMTFQLIAFFTVLINFTEADQNQAVTLPSSELAKPPEGSLEMPIFLHVTNGSEVIVFGQEVELAALKPLMDREYSIMDATPGTNPTDATIIIRADKNAKTGKVQRVIQACQDAKFEKFALRAKQEKST